jgi:hypothetical protein
VEVTVDPGFRAAITRKLARKLDHDYRPEEWRRLASSVVGRAVLTTALTSAPCGCSSLKDSASSESSQSWTRHRAALDAPS